MKYFAIVGGCVFLLAMVWWPGTAAGQDLDQNVLAQNISVAYQPPQASAEALLTLPKVYVLPGSFLYWCKHIIEQIQLLVADNHKQRSRLLLEFSQQRLAEGYQAIQKQDWPATQKALQDYQQNQSALAKDLSLMQKDNQDVAELLSLLRSQLGVQQALGEFVVKHTPKTDTAEISVLLKVRPLQTLALATAESGALLGAKAQRQSTQSAQTSSSATLDEARPAIPNASIVPHQPVSTGMIQ